MKKSDTKIHPSTVVENCTFIGAQYDAKAVDAITKIADGLLENAKALGSLARVLQASSVNIETMLRL